MAGLDSTEVKPVKRRTEGAFPSEDQEDLAVAKKQDPLSPPSAQSFKDQELIKKYAGRHAFTHNGVDAVYFTIELKLETAKEKDVDAKSVMSAIIRHLGHYGLDARIGRYGRDLWVRDAEGANIMNYISDDEMDSLVRKEMGFTSLFNQRFVTPEERAATASRTGYIQSHVACLVIPTGGRSTEKIGQQAGELYRQVLETSII